ncbi:adenylyl-sulfate kinase [Pseudodesulfovibrio portus]|uniref:Adenylyl-sulfate kinase n=1 Tax=Pseudodesulfovibrio portus TaxID=231439 RepID=A0ABN6RT35_9BACT|nr:adenylyl-sulfate kinase [Pseudodesulfovibrio portus]BDQ32823.1 putative adenylyl-sulfate kinase [Pseudodesulfovibrio portus]
MDGSRQPWAVWVVGLPGSGKSTLAQGIHARLAGQGTEAALLEMDARRKSYFPNPAYTPEERESAYRMFVDEAAELVAQGNNVIMDGSAYKVSMRRYARHRIERFAEIFIKCDLPEAVRRESARPGGKVMAGLYEKALRRKETGEPVRGLGDVIGVDVTFEIDEDAEFVIDNTRLSREEALGKIMHFLDTWLARA